MTVSSLSETASRARAREDLSCQQLSPASSPSTGYHTSQHIRKRIEEIFGWLKAIGGGRKLRYLGVQRNQLWAEMATSAFNLIRLGNLVAEAA